MTKNGEVRGQKRGNCWSWRVCRVRGVVKRKRIKQDEARIRGLEAEIEMRKNEYEELQEKYEALELALECERKKESMVLEVEGLRRMSHELSSKVGKDGSNLKIRLDDLQVDPQPASGATSDLLATPVNNVPSQDRSCFGGPKSRGIVSGTSARRLSYAEEERDHVIKFAPSTPGYPKSSFPGLKSCSSARSTGTEEDIRQFDVRTTSPLKCIGTPKRKIASKLDWWFNWKQYGDMLAAFKEPELCMMAVCVLYRQQTSYERMFKVTRDANGRGFSQDDARWGSEIAEFLTDGDLLGDMNKSVEELQARFPDPDGLQACREMASTYNKQLFEIYENKEDHFWQAVHNK
ncbi:unnamed protein product [Linum tenue]|uniref:Uncharacterized protein n=2 Tax=Linum tenue TaxID=586396 RepID=A0AAV0QNH5_9ROSI|nr:unnamed protein product [Linum tenue]